MVLKHVGNFLATVEENSTQGYIVWWIINRDMTDHYGISGYGVSRPGIQNKKGFCIKINLPKGNYWILRIGLMGSLSSLQKSEVLKLIISILSCIKLENLMWIRC